MVAGFARTTRHKSITLSVLLLLKRLDRLGSFVRAALGYALTLRTGDKGNGTRA